MMVVTEFGLVQSLHERFERQMYKALPQVIVKNIGFQGDNVTEKVHYSQEIGLWFASTQVVGGTKRFWNPVGVQDPLRVSSLDIITEVNIPFEHNRRVGGVFVQNETGRVFIAHRGTIGGGRKNIGKRLFMEQFHKNNADKLEEVDDNGRISIVAIVGDIDSSDLALNVKWFADEVNRIKNLVTQIKS